MTCEHPLAFQVAYEAHRIVHTQHRLWASLRLLVNTFGNRWNIQSEPLVIVESRRRFVRRGFRHRTNRRHPSDCARVGSDITRMAVLGIKENRRQVVEGLEHATHTRSLPSGIWLDAFRSVVRTQVLAIGKTLQIFRGVAQDLPGNYATIDGLRLPNSQSFGTASACSS